MNKKLYLLISIIVTLFIVFKFGFVSQTPLSWITNIIKTSYQDSFDKITNSSNKFFNQVQKIEELIEENKKLKEDNSVLNTFASEIINLSKLKNYTPKTTATVETVRTISYASLPDFNKIWIDFPGFKTNNIYGLIYNGATAGIVVSKNGSSALALLNGDSKCSYAVYVGDKKIPGVAIGRLHEKMTVKYIPIWVDIKIGDEVITSGLDEIFFEGVKVGKVTKILTRSSYKEVEIDPYYKSLKPDYFYIVTNIQL